MKFTVSVSFDKYVNGTSTVRAEGATMSEAHANLRKKLCQMSGRMDTEQAIIADTLDSMPDMSKIYV